MTGAPRAVEALSLLRAVVGLVGLAYYLRHYDGRAEYFGPDGVWGHALLLADLRDMGTWSVYAASPAPFFFECVFHLGMCVAASVMLGLGGRVVLAAHYALIWSLYMTNLSFMDGGDSLVGIATLFLLMTRCYSAFTLLPRRVRRQWHFGSVVLHNTGVLLLVTQVSVVYVMAGLYKVQGSLWQDGTALYYILRVPEFYWPGVTPFLFHSEWLLVIGAYGTVLSSIAFPFLVVTRATRNFAVALMLVFHLATAVLMGLTSFALIMAALDALFVNRHVLTAHARVRTFVTRARDLVTWRVQRVG